MAETKTPRFSVKHVDGVMHLTVHPETVIGNTPSAHPLRSLPVVVESQEP